MAGNLFELALDELAASDWELFEKLCGQFFTSEYPSLRTMANPSGDGGRDSQLFCPDDDPTICLQYSVSGDWASKIRRTHERLKEEFSHVRCLIYASNQQIGARGDDIKKVLLKENVFLDIRDKNWFLERSEKPEARKKAAEDLIQRVAIPYLREYEIRKSSVSPLKTVEARTALTYLSLQLHDDENAKGLTKVCFDALVRAALRDTSQSKSLTRAQVHEKILAAVPSTDTAILSPLIDASLHRLKGRVITHFSKTDAYFLRPAESDRIQNRLAETALLDSRFKSFLSKLCIEYLSNTGEPDPKDVKDLETRIPRIIEALCLSSGEQFVAAVTSGRVDAFSPDDLNTAVINDLAKHRRKSLGVARYPELIQHAIRALAVSDDADVRGWLKNVFTSYTLFAFLNQTPDVQAATKRIFSHGKIWLDTTAVLPVFAEQMLEMNHTRVFQTIFEACIREGDELYIIPGVLNEIQHHMKNCISCLQSLSTWQGKIPFLLEEYMKSGRALASFRAWLEEFRGDVDPSADLEVYLREEHGIRVRSLQQEAEQVDEDLSTTVKRLWTQAHEQRRDNAGQAAYDVLTQNDAEMYLGVLGLRHQERTSAIGARAWLLTKDSIAWSMRHNVLKEMPQSDFTAPLLSVSFLLNAIEFSPSRASLSRSIEVRLPTILDVEIEEENCPDLVKIAETVRQEHEGMPERIIQRRVRDSLAQARMREWHRRLTEQNDVSETAT